MQQKLTPAEITIVASGAVVFLFSFFAYFGSGGYSINGWDEFPLFTYGALIGLLMAGVVLAVKLGGVQLPAQVLGFTWVQIHLVLAIFAALNMIGIFIAGQNGTSAKLGLIFGVLGSIGLVVGAVMLKQEAEGRRRSGPSNPPSF